MKTLRVAVGPDAELTFTKAVLVWWVTHADAGTSAFGLSDCSTARVGPISQARDTPRARRNRITAVALRSRQSSCHVHGFHQIGGGGGAGGSGGISGRVLWYAHIVPLRRSWTRLSLPRPSV